MFVTIDYFLFLFPGEVAYETGIANLTSVSGFPSTFCTDVSLNATKYNNILPIRAVAAVDWSKISFDVDDYSANAVQTRVNGTILTICVYIAGGNGRSLLPTVMWVAFQENIHYRTGNTIYGGSLAFNTSGTSSSLCAKLPVSCYLNSQVFIF